MLNIIVDDINDVPEELRSHYVEKDGKHMLDADFKAAGLENVTNLKSALTTLKEERNSLREKYNGVKKFEKLLDIEGFEVDSVEELLAKAAGNGDPEAIERLQREHEKKLARKDEEITSLKGESDATKKNLTNVIVANHLTTAAIDAGVIKGSIDDVVSLTRSNFNLDDSGKVQVLDGDGDPMGITPKEFFENVYKDKKPHFFEAANASGSGAPHSAGSGGTSNKSWAEAKTPKEKVAAHKAKHGD